MFGLKLTEASDAFPIIFVDTANQKVALGLLRGSCKLVSDGGDLGDRRTGIASFSAPRYQRVTVRVEVRADRVGIVRKLGLESREGRR